LTHGIIDQTQYTVLVVVVIGSAIVPTLIAQTFFRPEVAPSETAETFPIPEPELAVAAVESEARRGPVGGTG